MTYALEGMGVDFIPLFSSGDTDNNGLWLSYNIIKPVKIKKVKQNDKIVTNYSEPSSVQK